MTCAQDKQVAETEQLAFWKGDFGNEYIERNQANVETIRKRIHLWGQILKTVLSEPIVSILEVGSNIGLNLRALQLLVDAELHAIEPNANALSKMTLDKIVKKENTSCASAFDSPLFKDNQFDLVFTSGVLIHIAPENLLQAVTNIVRSSKRFVACIEYFSDQPEEKMYRNYQNVLFKRDFGAYYLDHFPNLSLRDYGFSWKRASGLDNLNWWLFEKR